MRACSAKELPKETSMTLSKRGMLAGSSILVLAALLVACSGPGHRANMARATSAIPGQALVVDGQPHYRALENATPRYIARFALSHQSSCQTARPLRQGSVRPALMLQARWALASGIVRLEDIRGAFDVTSGTMVDPFMVFIMSSRPDIRQVRSPQYGWDTSTVTGNRITGYHATRWTKLSGSVRTSAASGPRLYLELWALDSSNYFYCVASTSRSL